MEEVIGSIPIRSTKSPQQFSSPFEFSPYLFQPKIQPKGSQTTAVVTWMAARNFSCAAICAEFMRCVCREVVAGLACLIML